MEVNRRWKHEYDLLKTKYLREKSELEEKNNFLKLEVSRLQNELTRIAKAVAERPHAKLDCCNSHTDQGCRENGNVTNQLIKEQVCIKRYRKTSSSCFEFFPKIYACVSCGVQQL